MFSERRPIRSFSWPSTGSRCRAPKAGILWIAAGAVVFLSCVSTSSGQARAAGPATTHLEYVLDDGTITVYDIDRGHRRIKVIPLTEARGIRGVAASPAAHMLFVSYGGDGGGGSGSTGSLLAFDLVQNRVLWTRSYDTGIDSFDVTPDGSTIYLPTGELSTGGDWLVINARTGDRVGSVAGGAGPHNTVVGLDGRYVYLGGRSSPYLDVASTKTNTVVRRIGPLRDGVRPFTINGRQTLAYTTATGFLGFQVSSIVTGKVLYTIPVPHFTYDPGTYAPSAPSHGISLSPDEKQLYLIDGPNSFIHVFDVSRGGTARPRLVANIKLLHPLTGVEQPCAYDCARDGWLQTSTSGRYLYVGDSGDVIDTRTRRVVRFLPTLQNTRKMLEIDWRSGTPVATTSRIGLGRVIKTR